MDDSSPEYFKNLGNRYVRDNNFDAAISSYVKALEKDPYYGPAWHNLGVLYEHMGDERAAKCFAAEKEVNIRLKQVQSLNSINNRKASPPKEDTPRTGVRPAPAPQPAPSYPPFLGRICSSGVAVGLAIIVLQVKFSGLFTTGNQILTPGMLAVIGLGILITTGSILAGQRLRYGLFCVIAPEYSRLLRDRDEPVIYKLLVSAIIGFQIITIPVFLYILLFRMGVNPYGTSNVILAIIVLVVVFFILTIAETALALILRQLRESRGEYTPAPDQLRFRDLTNNKMTYYTGFFGLGLLLVTLRSFGFFQDQFVWTAVYTIWLVGAIILFFVYPKIFRR
jgi:tetratricopeptide (TPR) repeat protein